jgi:hypothetical protein
MTGVKVKCSTSMTMMGALRWVAEHLSNSVFHSCKAPSAAGRFCVSSAGLTIECGISSLIIISMANSLDLLINATFSLFAKLRPSNLCH